MLCISVSDDEGCVPQIVGHDSPAGAEVELWLDEGVPQHGTVGLFLDSHGAMDGVPSTGRR